MKRTIIIGAAGGIILSLCGFYALFSGLAEMEITGEWNILAYVGYALMLPTMFLNYLKELTGFNNATAETIAMIILQLAWYIGIAILIRQLINRRKCEQAGPGYPPQVSGPLTRDVRAN